MTISQNLSHLPSHRYGQQEAVYTAFGQVNYLGKNVTVHFFNGDHYEGEVKNGKKHGRGIYTWKSGDRYEGEFIHDKPYGQGLFSWTNGIQYQGQYLGDHQYSKGALFLPNGDWYEGGFIHHKFQVKRGSRVFLNGDFYEGELEGELLNHQMKGHGTYIWRKGDHYKGSFVNSRANGQGTYVSLSGNTYQGSMENGHKKGFGTQIYQDGSRYDGEWNGDKRHGQGLMRYIDGRWYNGKWKNNIPAACLNEKDNYFIFNNSDELNFLKKKGLLKKHAMVLQSMFDYNNAFMVQQDKDKKLSEALDIGGYESQVIRFHSSKDLEEKIKKLSHKVDLVWLRAHGARSHIDCNYDDFLNSDQFSSIISPILNQNCSIVLQSCSTGKPEGFAENFMRFLDHSGIKNPIVIAPKTDVLFTTLNMTALLERDELQVPMMALGKGTIEDVSKVFKHSDKGS